MNPGTRPSMRTILPITLLAAAASLAAGGAFAQADSAPVSSDSPGALEAPEDWDCDRYEEEWREWVDDGNAPEAWRFAGKTYRAVSDGDIYRWDDWLEWAEDNNCLAGAYLAPQGASAGISGMTAVGAVLGTLAVAIVVASGGDNAMSPG